MGLLLTSRPGRFAPVKNPVPIVYESGWIPGPVLTGAKNLAPREIDPETSSPYRVCIQTTLFPPIGVTYNNIFI
jgi:hypothetical protein